jgi:hypothetical protein
MKKRSGFFQLVGGVFFLCALNHDQIGMSAEWPSDIENHLILVAEGSENRNDNNKILVEIFLANDRKGDLEAIKKEFAAFSITKVRPQFFKLGNPPQNIAVGRNVPADVARLAIRLANTYNQGIKFLLAEERLAADYLAIGTSIFDESFQIPVSPDDLKRLSDPALTTTQFHALYRHLTGEDKRPPSQ